MLRALTVAVALLAFAAASAHAQVPQPNDNFANAITLPATPSPVTADTITATRETDEPHHNDEGQESHASLWYRWTAPANATVQFDTCTTDYDTHLGVYTGTAVNALTAVRQNNNEGCPPATGEWGSRVVFNARKGVEYRIAVDGCCGAPEGQFTLSFTMPGNADFARRMPLSGPAPSVMSEIGGSTTNEPGEAGAGTRSVWYQWTAPASGTVAVNTCGQTASAINSRLTVYTGSAVNTLSQVADNDDASGCVVLSGNTTGSALTFVATAGTTYVIRVAQTMGVQVRFRLRINPTALANDELAGARALGDRSPSASDLTLGASHEADEPFAPVPFSGGSLWYAWTTSLPDEPITIDTCGSAVPTRLRVFTGTTYAGPEPLQPAGSNDDSTCAGRTVTTLTPTAGTSYRIQADNSTASQGKVAVNWSPHTFISDRPPAQVAASDLQFHFGAYDSSDGNADRMAYACSLDGGAYAPCDSPETYRGVAPGSHTFNVRAIDAAGTADPSPASAQVTTTSPPGTAGPPGPAGPAGPAGPPSALFVAIAPSRLAGKPGKRVSVPFVSTADGGAVLRIVSGRKVIATVRRAAKRGRNTIVWNGKQGRKAAKPGAYVARVAVTAGGATASDQVPLRVARAKKRR